MSKDPLWSSPFDQREPCPDCEDGNRYYFIDPRDGERFECSKDDYNKTPEDYRDRETCSTCNGEGWI